VHDYQSSNNLICKLIIRKLVLDPSHIDQNSYEQYKYTLFLI